MGLGSSFLEKVVIPYANSPSTNPIAKVTLFIESANFSFFHYEKTVRQVVIVEDHLLQKRGKMQQVG